MPGSKRSGLLKRCKPELMAPAGEWEALLAAVNNGADAVYLGGRLFNARQGAANFSHEELRAAVEYAHLRGVKVYVTVNVLLHSEEVPRALEFMHFLQTIGVDAVIVQDLGLAVLARRLLPELLLHASTQTTVHSIEGARFMRSLGFERVVLARELSLSEIKAIREKAGIEVEVFGHGALCICYSGQCLMSSLIGGRSGNRGRCAQPCRLQYTLVDRSGRVLAGGGGENERVSDVGRKDFAVRRRTIKKANNNEIESTGYYLLSPRDLNTSRLLPQLMAAGVDAIKIEGRMRRPEYVAVVTRIYRRLIDRAASGGEYYVTEEEDRQLAQIFNRDFTTGYLLGRPGRDLMSYNRPNNRGLLVGRVRSIAAPGLVEVHLQQPLRVGDGVEIWVTEGGRLGVEVRALYRRVRRGMPGERERIREAAAGENVVLAVPGKVRVGDRVFKTHDAALIAEAKASYNGRRAGCLVPVTAVASGTPGQPLMIKLCDEEGRCAQAATPAIAEQAVHHPLTPAAICQQLDRLGHTPYYLNDCQVALAGELMVPLSAINAARREAVETLNALRLAAMQPCAPVPVEEFRRRWQEMEREEGKAGEGSGRSAGERGREKKEREEKEIPRLAVAVNHLKAVTAAVEAGAEIVYFGGERFVGQPVFTPDDIVKAAADCRRREVEFIYYVPRITRQAELEQQVKTIRRLAEEGCLNGVLVGNAGAALAIKRELKVPLYGDWGLNVFNEHAALFWYHWGLRRVTLSLELTVSDVAHLARLVPVEIVVHGAVELMISEYCAPGALLGNCRSGVQCTRPCRRPGFALRDRMGVQFPLELDQFCRMHIFNAHEHCLLDELPRFLSLPVRVLRIEARRCEPGVVARVVSSYCRVRDLWMAGRDVTAEAQRLRAALALLAPGEFTRGHYYRGVREEG